ncbi:MAG TPA: hypothetical protein VM287_05805 [Egibacteraceae bacterium]|nr:hypothetical protein [Egibacteraceae bacterium]
MTKPRIPAGDERGSIPLALLAILVISGLVGVMMATTVSAQRQARHGRDFTTVLYAADAAVEQAHFRLSASSAGAARMPVTGSTLTGVQASCPLLGVSPCMGPPPQWDVQMGTYEWYAERVGYTRTWEVIAVGERNGVQRELRVLVEEGRRFFASAFGDSFANFGNNNVANSYDSGRPPRPPRWEGPGRAGWVGSNGTVETGGSSSVLDGLQMFNLSAANTTDPVTRCSGQGRIGMETGQNVCSNWARTNPAASAEGPYLQGFAQPRVISPGRQDLRTAMSACGPGPYPSVRIEGGLTNPGVFVTTGGTTVKRRSVPALQPFRVEPTTIPNFSVLGALALGTRSNPFVGVGRGVAAGETNYYCFSNVRIAGDTSIVAPYTVQHVTGTVLPDVDLSWVPLAVHANWDDPVVMYVTGNVEIESGRRFNCVACDRATFLAPLLYGPPRAGGLQIFLQRRLDTDPAPGFHVANDAQFGGAIHGPGANCGGAGSMGTSGVRANIYGALVCNTINGVGTWHFHYDESLEFIGNSDFGTQQWDER